MLYNSRSKKTFVSNLSTKKPLIDRYLFKQIPQKDTKLNK